MDSNEPTAWEDINPPMASAPRQGPLSPSLASLKPASNEDFRDELTACLALVAPVGMTEEARREWLSVAWITLKHLPADLLAHGCKVARETCDHPSKVVPTIIEATDRSMRGRRERSDYVALPAPRKRHIADRDRSDFTAADWAELNEYLERMGAGARYRSDGTRYLITDENKAA